MDIPEYIRRARNATDQGEFNLARQYLDQVLKVYPESPAALQALQELQTARAKKEWSVVTWTIKLALCQLLVWLGQAQRARNDLEILARIKPNNRYIQLACARCLQRLEDFKAAHEAYQKALALNATDAKTLQADAEVLIRLDRLDEANDLYERLHQLKPNDDKITHRLRDISAQHYSRIGVPEKLTERRAKMEKQKLEFDIPEEVQSQVGELLRDYEQNPQNHDLGVSIAQHYRRSQLFKQAERLLAPILDKNPNHFEARREQARVWHQSNEHDLAVNLFRELCAEGPDDLELQHECYQARIAQLQQQLARDEQNEALRQALNALCHERDQNRIAWLHEILRDHPEGDEARSELGELLIEHGAIDEAIEVLQRLLQHHAWVGRGYYLLGNCFRAKGDNGLAVSQYRKALEYFKNRGYSHVPSDELKSLWYNLALTEEALGNRKAAREALGSIYAADINYKDVRQRYEALLRE